MAVVTAYELDSPRFHRWRRAAVAPRLEQMAREEQGPRRVRRGPLLEFAAVLQLTSDFAEGARNRQTQCGQRHDADHRDQSQKQTVLGQRLPILTLVARH